MYHDPLLHLKWRKRRNFSIYPSLLFDSNCIQLFTCTYETGMQHEVFAESRVSTTEFVQLYTRITRRVFLCLYKLIVSTKNCYMYSNK